MNCQSGIYKYHNLQVEEFPYFLYEVSIYCITPKLSFIITTKYFKTNNLLDIDDTKVLKHYKNFNIIRFITLLGVPKSFIKENNLIELTKK
jgi:hypothetical protein